MRASAVRGEVASGCARAIDVVSLDDEPFVVQGGSGLGALRLELTSDELRWRAGWAAYDVRVPPASLRVWLPRDDAAS